MQFFASFTFFLVHCCIMFSHFFLFVFALARSALFIFILFNDYFLRCNEIVFAYIVKLSCRCQYFIYQLGNIFLKAVLFISLIGFLKVARYSFPGSIPPKIEHKLRRINKNLRFLRLTFLLYDLLVSRLLIYCKAVK